MPEPKIVIQNFVKLLRKKLKGTSSLVLQISDFGLIQNDEYSTIVNGLDWRKELNGKYDFIFGDLPFGLNRVRISPEFKIKVPRNWSDIIDSLRYLSDNGRAFYLVEPSIILSAQGILFTEYLADRSFFINAIFSPPEKLLYPLTSFRPMIIGIEKVKSEKYYIGELGEDNIDEILDNYVQNQNSKKLEQGLLIEKELFKSFSNFKVNKQIENLQTQYKEYLSYELNEIAKEINLTRVQFEDIPNSIYIPRIGTSAPTSNIGEIKIKHQNIFQVVLNESIVKAAYLSLFFKSEIGKLTLSSLTKDSFIPSINKSSIKKCIVAIPTINEQEILIHTNRKLNELQQTIDELKSELSLNPRNANVILEQFDSILNPLKKITIEDEILGVIRQGEGKTIEFKQTFSKNIRTNKRDKEIQKSTLKNIVGFLNADGGILLVGVSDNGEVTGVGDDYFKSDDNYLLNFKNLLNSKIGAEFYPLIDFNLHNVLGKKVLKIICKASADPCFYEDKEFYVRTNPATDRLEGKKQMEYIRKRFS